MDKIKNKATELMKKLTFSHKLAIVMMTVYILSIITTYIFGWFDKDVTNILSIVSSSVSIILLGYFGKALGENISRQIESSVYGDARQSSGEYHE